MPDEQWGASPNHVRRAVAKDHVNILRALADLIDGSAIGVRLDPSIAARSLSGLDDIEALLNDPVVELSPSLRAYVFHLITSIRTVLAEQQTLGDVDLVRHIHALFGVLNLIADDLEADGTTETASKLREAARRVVPVARWVTIAAAGTLDVAANIAQITSMLPPSA